MNEEEFTVLKKDMEEFQNGEGQKLHRILETRLVVSFFLFSMFFGIDLHFVSGVASSTVRRLQIYRFGFDSRLKQILSRRIFWLVPNKLILQSSFCAQLILFLVR